MNLQNKNTGNCVKLLYIIAQKDAGVRFVLFGQAGGGGGAALNFIWYRSLLVDNMGEASLHTWTLRGLNCCPLENKNSALSRIF